MTRCLWLTQKKRESWRFNSCREHVTQNFCSLPVCKLPISLCQGFQPVAHLKNVLAKVVAMRQQTLTMSWRETLGSLLTDPNIPSRRVRHDVDIEIVSGQVAAQVELFVRCQRALRQQEKIIELAVSSVVSSWARNTLCKFKFARL